MSELQLRITANMTSVTDAGALADHAIELHDIWVEYEPAQKQSRS